MQQWVASGSANIILPANHLETDKLIRIPLCQSAEG